MNRAQASLSFRGTTCPCCSGYKAERKAVCSSCWRYLPPVLRGRLYKRFGRGYEEAVSDAAEYLARHREASEA